MSAASDQPSSKAWNIRDKHVLVTGGSSGIGYASALELARRGARLTLTGRDAGRGSDRAGHLKRLSGNRHIEFRSADFASLLSVRALADALLQSGEPIDVLINNAGVFNTRRNITIDSIEEMFAVNYLAHVLLTRLLLPRLQQSESARIVHVASGAHRKCERINFSDINHSRKFAAYAVYGHSKLANILFSNELARRLEGSRVSSNAMHPGVVYTGLGSNNGFLGKLLMRTIKSFVRTAAQGAETVVYLACAPELVGITGQYFKDLTALAPTSIASDTYEARRLWQFSERLLDGYL